MEKFLTCFSGYDNQGKLANISSPRLKSVKLYTVEFTIEFIVNITSITLAKQRQYAFSRAAVIFSLMHSQCHTMTNESDMKLKPACKTVMYVPV